ncbi:MAG: hypothetical protein JRG71_12860, partial [Deltaproteobacteria bacterium]|nr:hypothetical protein [Deltaproteobacteria bacterium]
LDFANSSIDDALGHYYWELFPKQDSPLAGCLVGKNFDTLNCNHKLTLTIGNKTFSSQSFAIFDPQQQFLYSVHLTTPFGKGV